MKLDSAGYVAIVQLIVFIPALVASIILCTRHGFSRSSGWIYTGLLCILRIGGSICQLLTYTNHSIGLLIATLIFYSIGLSPLLFATLGLISRFADCINATGKQVLDIKHLRAIQLLILLPLILSIVGGTSIQPDSQGVFHIPATSKAAVALYLVAFLLVCAAFAVIFHHRSSVNCARERRVPIVVGLALPLILVRVVYSLIATFANNKQFSLYGGSVGIRVGMATIEEFLVVAMFIVLGLTLDKLDPESRGELAHRGWKLTDTRRQRRQRS